MLCIYRCFFWVWSWVICRPSATVEAGHVGDTSDSRHLVSRTKHQVCGRSKIEKGKKKIIAIADFHPFNSSVRRVKCTGLNLSIFLVANGCACTLGIFLGRVTMSYHLRKLYLVALIHGNLFCLFCGDRHILAVPHLLLCNFVARRKCVLS